MMLVGATLSLPLIISACGAAPAETEANSVSVDYKACAVSGAGGWNDHSFNEQVYNGLQQAKKKLGVPVVAFESKTADDFVPGISSLVDQGCKLVFSVGFDANDAVNAAAAANPEVRFVTVDGFVEDPGTTNLKAVTYKMSESSYLAGYLAAAQSKSHTLGTFGAIQNTAITDFMTGFFKGSQEWAKKHGTPTKVIGWEPSTKTGVFVGDFSNQITAKSIAGAQLDQGADVLFPVAGPLFSAAAEAIKDTGDGATFLGVDSDVAVTTPEYKSLVLTSVEKRMTKAVEQIIGDASKGTFDSQPYVGTLENDGTGLSPFHDFDGQVSAELRSELDDLRTRIVSGSVETLG
ncbi:hypothetical protein ASG77_08420 [Arthrobacter sp. Soil762]|nr:hypothetical protein ASG77_08420 [Arthrobacter sp. Soil762]